MIHATASSRTTGQVQKLALAFIAVLIAAFAVAMAPNAAYAEEGLAAGAVSVASADSVEYRVGLSTTAFAYSNTMFAMPGDKIKLTAETQYYDSSKNKILTEKKATYKWTAPKALKAKTKGATLTVAKAPKKGTYKITLVTKVKGKQIDKKTYKIAVKPKAPNVKIQTFSFGEQGTVASTSFEPNEQMQMIIKGAKWSWSYNAKKSFYAWTVKNLDTGKTAKWNSKNGTFKKNDFVGGGSVAGSDVPTFMGLFSQAGTYKVTAKVYHADKKIATATKIITVQ